MNYFKKTLHGVSWMAAFRVTTRGITFLRIFILARLLDPYMFGLFGIAALVLAFLETITETGINVFLIQHEEPLEKYVDTAWVVSIIRGTLISLLILVSAPFVSDFFQSPSAFSLISLMALIPLIRGFINPSSVRFQKNLEFNKEFLYRLTIFLVDSSVTVLLAFYIRSATSLVWGLIAGATAEVLLSHLFIQPRPRLTFEIDKIKKVINRGKWLTLAGVMQYFFQNGDNIVVGKLLGSGQLGLYDMAYKISILPITEVSDVFGKVTFPAYTQIQSDRPRLKIAFYKTVLGISILVIPIGLLLFTFSAQIVLLFLGEKWISIIEVLKLLSIFAIIRAIYGSLGALFLAVKKQEYLTMLTLINILGLAIPIVPLVHKYGIIGAAMAAMIGQIAAIPLAIYYLNKVFKPSHETIH